jgi:hypothetical protein
MRAIAEVFLPQIFCSFLWLLLLYFVVSHEIKNLFTKICKKYDMVKNASKIVADFP